MGYGFFRGKPIASPPYDPLKGHGARLIARFQGIFKIIKKF
jgi:hypothetical protein